MTDTDTETTASPTDPPADDVDVDVDVGADTEPPSRKEILNLLEDGIREAHRKVENGRVYDEEKERVRQQWIRTLAYTAGQYRQLKNDEDLDELQEDVELLKEVQGIE